MKFAVLIIIVKLAEKLGRQRVTTRDAHITFRPPFTVRNFLRGGVTCTILASGVFDSKVFRREAPKNGSRGHLKKLRFFGKIISYNAIKRQNDFCLIPFRTSSLVLPDFWRGWGRGYSQNRHGTKNGTRFSQWCLYT